MTETLPRHDFDESRATPFRPRDEFVKTAILLQLAEGSDARIAASYAPFRSRTAPIVVQARAASGSIESARPAQRSACSQSPVVRWSVAR